MLATFERKGKTEVGVGEDGRPYEEDAYASKEVPSYEDIIAMCSKIQLYLRKHHSDGQATNMVLSVERCLRKERIRKRFCKNH